MGGRVRTTTLILLLAGLAALGACDGPRAAEAARTPFEQQLADSAAGDSAAFATLPPALGTWLDVREHLHEATRADLDFHECVEMETDDAMLRRRRVRMRLPDETFVVLYAVADRGNGELDRVEYIRRQRRDGQRGLVWESSRDRTFSTWWPEGSRGLSRRSERGEIPRGGPVPRALRALGRELFVIPCQPAPPDAGTAGRR